jgi:hypothetical protein
MLFRPRYVRKIRKMTKNSFFDNYPFFQAMAAGITNRVWKLEEIMGLLP